MSVVRRRPLAIGSATWLALVAAAVTGVVRLSLIDLLLVLAPLVVVPLGLAQLARDLPRPLLAGARLAQLPAALLVTLSLVLAPGPGAALLAGAWFVPVGLTGIAALVVLVRVRDLRPAALAPVAAAGFLVIGAGWLVISRSGAQVGTYSPVVVELTAVHFHYAGFATAIIASLTVRATRPGSLSRRAAGAACYLVVAGTPLVALGLASRTPPIGFGGAVLLASGVITIAGTTLVVVVRKVPRVPGLLLAASSISVALPMLLAVAYTARPVFGTPALGLPDMAATHGVLNSLFFSVLGLIGWTLVKERAAGIAAP